MADTKKAALKIALETAKILGTVIGIWMIFFLVVATPFLVSSLFTLYYNGKIDRITHMASQEEVRALMGVPDHIGLCNDWNSEEKNTKCDSEWTYVHFLTPVDEWIVSFDKDGRVISASHLISP